MRMALTILAALGSELLVCKLKMPGDMLIGSILGAVALKLTTRNAFIYPQTQVVAQSLLTSADYNHKL